MARTGIKNPHRSGLRREPRMFEQRDLRHRSTPATVEMIYDLTAAAAKARQEAMSARNAEGEAAWEAALAPARLPLGHPDRVPYPEAVSNALVAWDAVMEAHR